LFSWQYLLFTETWRHSMLASRFCKIRGEKHPRAFVKVVESSEIYNFPIHHLVHFSSKNLSFYRSDRASPTFLGTLRRRPCAGAASGPPACAPRVAALPEAPFPEATHRPKAASKFSPLLTPRGWTSAQRTTSRFCASPCRALLPRPAHAPRDVVVGLLVAGRHTCHP
jgi:hypothetical protein